MKQRLYRLHDRANISLGASASDPHSLSRLGELRGQVDRHEENWDLRKKLCNLLSDIQPVKVRHLKIHQDQVRRWLLLHPLQCFTPGASLVAHLPCALLLKDRAEVMPHRRIVIHHENADQGNLHALSLIHI